MSSGDGREKPEAERPLLLISPERPIQVWVLKWDYKLIWLGAILLISLISVIVSSQAQAVGVGFVVSLFLSGFYGLCIAVRPLEKGHTSILAWLFRWGNYQVRSWLGDNQYASNDPEKGEVFFTKHRQP